MTRGMFTVEALKARCKVDPRGCWIWQGACTDQGIPRMHTLDLARLEKRSMSGPLAAWHIAYGKPPREGFLVMRGCMVTLCLNPVHLREMKDRKAIGEHIRRSGARRGTSVEQRRKNLKAANAAAGITPTSAEIVRAIRAADKSVTGLELSKMYGIARQTVSRIRLGQSHRDVV